MFELKTKSKSVSESDIEKAVCDYAKSKTFLTEKFTSPGRRSVPDRLMTPPGGTMFFIEFKAPGKEPTPKQARDHKRRRDRGQVVYIVDDITEGLEIIDNEFEWAIL